MSGNAAGATAVHAVAMYDSDEDLRRPVLRDGRAAGEATVAVVSDRAAVQLRAGLGPDHRDVRWQLPGIGYESLGPMFHGLHRYLARQYEAGTRIRLLAENDTSSSPARTAAYLRFEAASNDVLGAYGFPWACLYDRNRYPGHVLEQVAQVHPTLLDRDGRTTASPAYLPPDTYLDAHPGPLSTVPPDPVLDIRLTAAGQVPAVRHTAAEAALGLGLPTGDGDDFELATAEVLSNAVRHGELPCRVRLWATAGHVVLRVDDRGPGDAIATKGFRPPDPARGHLGGMGVWMIRQLADAVHVTTGPSGTAVELQFPRPGRRTHHR
jgi:anti-sigma regulatory factor (Ser/Thr protein kinase)